MAWFAGRIGDAAAVELMAGSFARLCEMWRGAGA